MNDSYFKSVPSMQPANRKTALAFHAKDDLPEVRRDVFRLLCTWADYAFLLSLLIKLSVLEYVRQRNKREPTYRIIPMNFTTLWLSVVQRETTQSSAYDIIFSKRGKSDRTAALHRALETARSRFVTQQEITSRASLNIAVATPKEHVGLQAVDYFIWALQRL